MPVAIAVFSHTAATLAFHLVFARVSPSRALFTPLVLTALVLAPAQKPLHQSYTEVTHRATIISYTSSTSFTLQELSIPTSALEPEFQNLKDAKGKPITSVVCNKGL